MGRTERVCDRRLLHDFSSMSESVVVVYGIHCPRGGLRCEGIKENEFVIHTNKEYQYE